MIRHIVLNNSQYINGEVIYWMSRDQRVQDNWALIHAYNLSKEYKCRLRVIFCIYPKYLESTDRNYAFMLKGLQEVSLELKELNISFEILKGDPTVEIPKYIKERGVGVLVSDFSPLKYSKSIKERISKDIKIPFHVVDAHNIIPVWVTSQKQEYGAYTIRPKINKLLGQYLEEFPKIERIDENESINSPVIIPIQLDPNLPIPGSTQANIVLNRFLSDISKYTQRNDPNTNSTSNLSPYLHFGQISAQRVVMEAMKLKHSSARDEFLEEIIVRRELSDNFCHYNNNYDNFQGFPLWAKNTLNEHREDRREYLYTLDELEKGNTHDKLWNSAQNQMVKYGKMHGYMRMYWGKKIVEWSKTPEIAIRNAIYLNDKYELDGRDPNGYTGIAWCIGGVHDRAWSERDIFGKIRYMNYNGCKRKFNTEEYIARYEK